MSSDRVSYKVEKLQISSQAALDQLVSDGGEIKTTLQRITSKPTYTETELRAAIKDLKRIDDQLTAGLDKIRHEIRAGYAAVRNVSRAACDVQRIFEDILEDGRSGCSRGQVSPFGLESDLNQELSSADELMGGRLSSKFGLDNKSPTINAIELSDHDSTATPKSISKLAHLAGDMLECVRQYRTGTARLTENEHAVLKSLEHTLQTTVDCVGSPKDMVKFINPVAGITAAVLGPPPVAVE